jgi:hypothetical protein
MNALSPSSNAAASSWNFSPTIARPVLRSDQPQVPRRSNLPNTWLEPVSAGVWPRG